jgi:hypothetical protein
MTEAERQTARSVLINGLSIRQLIAYLEGKSYRDLVDKHMHDIGLMLPATIAVHEDLIAPDERDGAVEILAKVANQASEPSFWSIDAGGFLTSVSCDLNDAVFPKPADEAGVFNLFQLVTAKLADRARVDKDFCRILLSLLTPRGLPSPAPSQECSALQLAIATQAALAKGNFFRSSKVLLTTATSWRRTTSCTLLLMSFHLSMLAYSDPQSISRRLKAV